MTHPWIGLALGIGLLAIGRLELNHTLLLLNSGVRTLGYVKGFREEKRDDDTMYYPIISFVDKEGKERTVPATVGSNSKHQEIGQMVTVLYIPGDPESARVEGLLDLWLAPFGAFLMGTVICGGCVLELLK